MIFPATAGKNRHFIPVESSRNQCREISLYFDTTVSEHERSRLTRDPSVVPG